MFFKKMKKNMQILSSSLKRWNYDAIYKVNLRPICSFESLVLHRVKKKMLNVRFMIVRKVYWDL